MLDLLSQRLQDITFGLDWDLKDRLTESDVDAACKQVRTALLEADVNLRAVQSFLVRVKEKAVGEQLYDSISPEQQFVGILYEELTQLLGTENKPLDLSGQPSVILLFGLQGSGKTTTAAKLARQLQEEGHRPLLVAADTVRPAAIDQLIQLGQRVELPVFHLPGESDMLTIVEGALTQAQQTDRDVVLVDTAGRLQVDTEVMANLLLLERAVAPQEKLLVIDALMGQEAVPVAEAFDAQLGLTGLILTKLDGDSRGGAILSVVEATGKPIKWIGTGETPADLERFHPERMATRMLGMGDVASLFEKARTTFESDNPLDWTEKIRSNRFTYDDFLNMQQGLTKLGSLDQILGMLPIPGLNKEMKEKASREGETALKQARLIIGSMTKEERANPDLMNEARMKRLAKGTGLPEKEIVAFIERFEQMRSQMKQMSDFMGMLSGDSDPDASEPDDSFEMPAEKKHSTGASKFSLPGNKSRKKKKAASPFDLFSGW